MAAAVARTIDGEGHLLVQAGTGTGKSLGYLVPAVAHAVRSGERVVVSTATLALQRQIRTRDLPLVAQALRPRLPREPRAALLKGWSNYVCRHKLAGGYPEEEPASLFTLPGEPGGPGQPPGAGEPAGPLGRRAGDPGPGVLGAQVLRVREWAEKTPTGDRDDLVPGVSDRAWRQVSVTALECLGTSCPMRAECFPLAAREQAAMADVVVTNHAMLGIAAAGSPGALPDHDVLVVDEAHELADRVTAQATAELSAAAVEQAARRARRLAGVPTGDLDAAGEALASALALLPEQRFAQGLPPDVATAVAGVASAARSLLSALKPEGTPSTSGAGGGSPAQAGVKVAAAAVLALFEVAERMAAQQPSGDVLWLESVPGGQPRLRAAPLDVSALVADRLLAGRRAVLTSATLTLGGDFAPAARAVGLRRRAGVEGVGVGQAGANGRTEQPGPERAGADGPQAAPGLEAAAGTWQGIDVGSPFDYPRQAILYLARRLPPPTREGTSPAVLEELAGLVDAAGGATLGLFSSRRAAVAAAEAVRAKLGVPVLCQGDDQLPTLVRRFTDDDATCLFGTLSLWQGVDVPGETCRLVVIDRIPFPRPDDPVRSARAEAADAAGRNGFLEVSASHAALLLAQGAGRLIRSATDRGVVAVLDPRVATARYGGFLLRSMPGMWRTDDGAVARAALRRLRPQGAPGGPVSHVAAGGRT